VITSSVNGTRTFSTTGATAYSCTKGAQVVMAKMLALELAQDRIRVNVICPGSISTDIVNSTTRRNLDKVTIPRVFPDGRRIPLTDGERGTPEDVGQLVLFLASDAAKHISGTEMWIDGAQTLL
jgi:NAD(P)-dependent dehydrogenase (short-subunit alcohol dehydrogenase family)